MSNNRSFNDRSTSSAGSARMKSAVTMAKSQPRRAVVQQPSNNGPRPMNGQLDPQWQQKVSGSAKQPSSFRPTSGGSGGNRLESNFSSSSVGNTNRRRPGQPAASAFDAKGFLRQQQKGQFLRSPTHSTLQNSSSQQPQQQQRQQQHFSPASDPAKFDINQFKASAPRKVAAPAQQKVPQQTQQKVPQQTQQNVPQQTVQNKQPQSVSAASAMLESDVALPWQAANRNVAARASKPASSKDVLQQMAAMRANKQQQAPTQSVAEAVLTMDQVQADAAGTHEQLD